MIFLKLLPLSMRVATILVLLVVSMRRMTSWREIRFGKCLLGPWQHPGGSSAAKRDASVQTRGRFITQLAEMSTDRSIRRAYS